MNLNSKNIDQTEETAIVIQFEADGDNDEIADEKQQLLLQQQLLQQQQQQDQEISFYSDTVQPLVRFLMKQAPLYFAVMLIVCAELWTAMCQVFTVRVTAKLFYSTQVLPDFGFDRLPYLQIQGISDVFIGIIVISSIVAMLLTGPRVFMILRRLLFVAAIMYFFRGISIALTVMPNPYTSCVNRLHPSSFVATVLIILGANVTCADVFFSGHAAAITLCACFWHTYATNIYLIYTAWIMTVAGYFIIIMNHFHYTMDVVFGFFFAFSIWTYYHYMVTKRKNVVASSALWTWFERDSHVEKDKRSTITFLFGPAPINTLLYKLKARTRNTTTATATTTNTNATANATVSATETDVTVIDVCVASTSESSSNRNNSNNNSNNNNSIASGYIPVVVPMPSATTTVVTV